MYVYIYIYRFTEIGIHTCIHSEVCEEPSNSFSNTARGSHCGATRRYNSIAALASSSKGCSKERILVLTQGLLFCCLEEVSKSVEVPSNGIEADRVLTLIILKKRVITVVMIARIVME